MVVVYSLEYRKFKREVNENIKRGKDELTCYVDALTQYSLSSFNREDLDDLRRNIQHLLLRPKNGDQSKLFLSKLRNLIDSSKRNLIIKKAHPIIKEIDQRLNKMTTDDSGVDQFLASNREQAIASNNQVLDEKFDRIHKMIHSFQDEELKIKFLSRLYSILDQYDHSLSDEHKAVFHVNFEDSRELMNQLNIIERNVKQYYTTLYGDGIKSELSVTIQQYQEKLDKNGIIIPDDFLDLLMLVKNKLMNFDVEVQVLYMNELAHLLFQNFAKLNECDFVGEFELSDTIQLLFPEFAQYFISYGQKLTGLEDLNDLRALITKYREQQKELERIRTFK